MVIRRKHVHRPQNLRETDADDETRRRRGPRMIRPAVVTDCNKGVKHINYSLVIPTDVVYAYLNHTHVTPTVSVTLFLPTQIYIYILYIVLWRYTFTLLSKPNTDYTIGHGILLLLLWSSTRIGASTRSSLLLLLLYALSVC